MGMSESAYSVSFPRQRASTGPKPIENRSTPTPTHRATRKWPSSWIRISTPITTTNDTTIVTALPSGALDPRSDLVPGPGIGGNALLDGRERTAGMPVERALDERGDFHEADAPVEERGDGDFVGGIEDGRREPAGVERRARQAQTREPVGVGREERESADPRQIEPRGRHRTALRIRERV